MTHQEKNNNDKFNQSDFSLRLLDHFLEGCQLIGRDWRYLYINDAAVGHSKKDKKDLLGKTMMEVYPGIENTPMFDLLSRCMEKGIPGKMENKFSFGDGSNGWFELRFEPVADGVLILSYDITEHKLTANELSLSIEILQLINAAENKEKILKSILKVLREYSGCEAVGIRLKKGCDYPYFVTTGFSDDFVEKERHLCNYDDFGNPKCDSDGEPFLECMCGNIISGRFDVSQNFFTTDGSFWSNSPADLLAIKSDIKTQSRIRNRCSSEGYESVALIPLKSGNEILGLIQFNDKKKYCFTPKKIALFRRIADQIAGFISKKDVEEALQKSEQKLRLMAETIKDVFWITSRSLDKIVYVSPAYEILWERSCESLYKFPKSFLEPVHPDDLKIIDNIIRDYHIKGKQYDCEYRLIDKKGKIRWINARGFPVADSLYNGQLMTGICTDITAKKIMEEQFQQAQKLESIGRLAGGVAHDFNNILAVQLGYCDIMLASLSENDRFFKKLSLIRDSAQRGASLTRQLLAFSRKQSLKPDVLNLNSVITNIEKMLHRMIGEDIELNLVLNQDIGKIKVDTGQIEQVLMNLAVNARDAMPKGGKLTIKTEKKYIDEDYSGCHIGINIGHHIILEISDTGCGMDEETTRLIFEPFFTTKEAGKGTGLGLATVYGIVKQSGASIFVYSEVGYGTTFKIYFPCVEGETETVLQAKTSYSKGNGELIVVVDDDPDIRILVGKMLESLGYMGIVAKNGEDAVSEIEKGQLKPDLLITDVVMPGQSGKELSEYFVEKYKGVKVIFMSGYAGEIIAHHGVADENVVLLQKPFTRIELAEKVRDKLMGSNL